DALRARLQQYSFAIILGTGPHHSTIIRALQKDKNRIVVDQRVGLGWLSHELDLPHRARGLRCVQKMQEVVTSTKLSELPEQQPSSTTLDSDFLTTLQTLWQQNLETYYEELPAVHEQGPLNIFFSVGPVQD